MQLVRIGRESRQSGRDLERDLDPLRPKLVGEQLDGALDDLGDRHLRSLRRALARERQEVADDPNTPLGGVDDLSRAPDERGLGHGLAQQLRLSREHGQRVVQLVGDAGQQRAHGRHLLALQQPLRPLPHRLVERAILALERQVQAARIEEISDAQHDLQLLEGLGQEIMGARGEGATSGVGRHVRGEDDHRHEGARRELGRQLLEDGHAVEVRHEQSRIKSGWNVRYRSRTSRGSSVLMRS